MKKLFGNLVLALVGLTFALAIAEMFVRMFPDFVPIEVRVNPPSRRVKAYVDDSYDVYLSDGDLFHHMRGKLAPVSPDQDRVVDRVHMVTDANGFRNSLPEKDAYDIVALGDSFTRASGVGSPWPQLLADSTGSDIFNLADVGFGPQDELKVLEQYGLEKHPQWVIMAYFEGNDLYDAGSYDQANPFILARFGRYLLNSNTGSPRENPGGAQPNREYRYPITLSIGNKNLETAFFSYYVSWLSVHREMIETSRNYELVRQTIFRTREVSEAAGAQFLLVYIPSKEHVYLPYVTESDLTNKVFVDVPAIGPDEAGLLQFQNEKTTPELTDKHMNDQASLMADLAAENQILYLDLTPIFQEEAGKGAELYFPFDTHCNQNGHDLAAQSIAVYMEDLLATRAHPSQ